MADHDDGHDDVHGDGGGSRYKPKCPKFTATAETWKVWHFQWMAYARKLNKVAFAISHGELPPNQRLEEYQEKFAGDGGLAWDELMNLSNRREALRYQQAVTVKIEKDQRKWDNADEDMRADLALASKGKAVDALMALDAKSMQDTISHFVTMFGTENEEGRFTVAADFFNLRMQKSDTLEEHIISHVQGAAHYHGQAEASGEVHARIADNRVHAATEGPTKVQ